MKNISRMTPQTKAVVEYVNQSGHATNKQILLSIRSNFPNLSATTVHRITQRLISAGLLARGPEIEGSTTVDSNLRAHDHFICKNCNGLKDININDVIRVSIQKQTGLSVATSQLTIFGDCTNCRAKRIA
jgi:Fur family transcriptional regulator, peroxide stress response regulator